MSAQLAHHGEAINPDARLDGAADLVHIRAGSRHVRAGVEGRDGRRAQPPGRGRDRRDEHGVRGVRDVAGAMTRGPGMPWTISSFRLMQCLRDP